MKRKFTPILFVILFSIIVIACTPTSAEVIAQDIEPFSDTEQEMKSEPTAEPVEPMEEAVMTLPAWYETQLLNVNSGETFRIADHLGKVILVETMATWCSNCLQQQKEVIRVPEYFANNPDFVGVGIDIDLNENEETLRAYTAKHGFDWYYAVASEELALEISSLYGNQFLNPPSTPILIIDRQGNATTLRFGIKPAEDLIQEIEARLAS